MLRRIERWFVICSLVILIGGHWAILQSFAWAGMIASFSSDAPIQEALIKTFNGKHPCKLCQFVAKAKKSEEKRNLLKLEIKLEFTLDTEICGLFPHVPFVSSSGVIRPRRFSHTRLHCLLLGAPSAGPLEPSRRVANGGRH